MSLSRRTAIGLLPAASVLFGTQIAAAQDAIKIGVTAPLSGPAAEIGHLQLEGARLGVEKVNAAGGVLGRQLELVVEDDQTTNPGIVLAFSRLINRGDIVAALTSVLAVALAVVLAYGLRLRPSPVLKGAVRIASMGYAVPGSVIAIGVLIPFARLDNALDAFLVEHFGISTGLLLSGTIAALVFAYLVRFLAVSFNTIEASLGKIRPNMDQASRVLGQTPSGTLVKVHAPLMLGSLLTAGLLVFVDVMKELPATLIVRPFNFDTLAVRTYQLAADERLAEASAPALAIVAVGILPVILLSVAITRSRPGHAED